MSKEKHLEFIQGVINRHNSNSFMLKGWAITIASALYALGGTINQPFVIFIALIPIFLFWGLDAFYLTNERCFVDLYSSVAKGKYSIPTKRIFKKEFVDGKTDMKTGEIPDFEMNFKRFKIWKDNHCWQVAKSNTILWFYLPLSITSILVFAVLLTINTNEPKTFNVKAKIETDTLRLKMNENPYEIINNIYNSEKQTDSLKTTNK